MDRSSSRLNDRPMPTSVDTSARMPRIVTEQSPGSAVGEPLVHDFQMHYNHVPPNKRSPTPQSPHDLPAAMSFSTPELDGDQAPPPPDFAKRRAHANRKSLEVRHQAAPRIATQQANSNLPRHALARERQQSSSTASVNTTLGPGERSSEESVFSQETTATSIQTLPPLQTKGPPDETDQLEPVLEDDPKNFDLVTAPPEETTGLYQLEKRAEQLLSSEHLRLIFSDPQLLLNFTGFLSAFRSQSISTLIYYLDALKALRAIEYANAIAEALEPIPGLDFTSQSPRITQNPALQEKADRAFDMLVREDLPAYIAHVWIQVVSVSIQRRITGTLAPHLREASEGLAEVFCLSDPSRPDNPIVFASEEFHRTTQYGMNYAIGRNCRFLQGPRTNPNSVRRLAEAVRAGKETTEVFVNYRRDGSPFMNLLMIAPLMDSRGTIRYFIGAQTDVSGLLKNCTDLEALQNLVERAENPVLAAAEDEENHKDELQALTEMFNATELDTVRKFGGSMHREHADESDRESIASHRPRLVLKDRGTEVVEQARSREELNPDGSVRLNGRLPGVYQNYLLVRPAPSLRILFTSPSLRVPGILQSPFLSRIGGSSRVRKDLEQALGEGRGVTAKIRWLTRPDEEGEGEGRSRWIHCTPLLGHSGAVGVWMVVLVDEEGERETKRRFRAAPPIANTIGGKEYVGRIVRDKAYRHIPTANTPSTGSYDGAGGYFAGQAPAPKKSQLAGVQDATARPSSVLSGKIAPQSELSFALK